MGKIEERMKELVDYVEKVAGVKVESCELSPGYEDSDDYLNIDAYVPFDQLKGAQEKLWAAEDRREMNASVSLKPIDPTLVPANLGDYVLVWSDWKPCEEELAVGIVTATYKSPEGTACYGCRHIVPKSKYGHSSDAWGGCFELSPDNYGGHPKGFFKIISRDEALRRAAAAVRQEYKEWIERINEELETLDEDILSAVSLLTNVVQTTELRAEPLK